MSRLTDTELDQVERECKADPDCPWSRIKLALVDEVRESRAWNIVEHLHAQRSFSERAFGPGARTHGIVDHIRKELDEILAAPGDLAEWIDVVMLAFDGAWRSGATPHEIVAALRAKLAKNEARKWPDWRTADPTKAIEHDRSADAAPAAGGAAKPAPAAPSDDEARRDYTFRLVPSDTDRCHDCVHMERASVSDHGRCKRLDIVVARTVKSRCHLWSADKQTRSAAAPAGNEAPAAGGGA